MLEIVKNIRQTSIGATRKFFFVLSNFICGLTSLLVFAFSIYESQRITNYFRFTLAYPIILATCCGFVMLANLIACLGVIAKSIRMLRIQYLAIWVIFLFLFVFLHVAIVPSIEECGGIVFKRAFVDTQKRLMVGALWVQILMIATLFSSVEFSIQLQNELNEAELMTIKSLCDASAETLDE